MSDFKCCIIEFLSSSEMENISDVHIKEGERLCYRQKMCILFVDILISYEDIRIFLEEIDRYDILDRLRVEYNVDFSFEFWEYRYRGNIYLDSQKISISLRKIDKEILDISRLNLPQNVLNISSYSSGIVFITGPTGSGKTTTLASLIDYINNNFSKHIITIEDPIEQVFESKNSLIGQREVGRDVDSFSNAIKSALRQDPDIIVIGEVRDIDTMNVVIRAAETGHLCICTLHTLGVANSIERVIGMYSKQEQDSIKYELSLVLKCILSQQLIKVNKNGDTYIKPVLELMFSDKSIANMIRENKINQISNYIMTNSSKGLISMDKSMVELYKKKLITRDYLIEKSIDKDYTTKQSRIF